MKRFFKKAAQFVALFFAMAATASMSAYAGFVGSAVLAGVCVFALIRPLPKLGFQNRVFSGAVLIFVASIGMITSTESIAKSEAAYLEELKSVDPKAYLAELESSDPVKWLSELKVMDPDEFVAANARIIKAETDRLAAEENERNLKAAEQERIAAEKAQTVQAKAAKNAMDKADRFAASEKLRLAEVARKRDAQCGAGNATSAYLYSQQFVEQRLRAPSTADFPPVSAITARAAGSCTFQIVAYVEAQNAFGAMLRTPYSAVMKRLPEQDSWQLVSLDFAG